MIKINRVDHLNYKVKKFDETIAFYGEHFGFKKIEGGVRMGRRWALIGIPGSFGLCIYEEPERYRDGNEQYIEHFGINVENFEETKEYLKGKGLRFLYGGVVDYDNSQSIYIADPNGYEIEISKYVMGGN